MHDYIYELSSRPIPENERYSLFDIPDWFHGSIADSVYDADGDERELAIESFVRSLGSCCSYEDGVLRFTGNVKEGYFKGSFEAFQEAAARLATTDYREFSGQEHSHEFIRAMTNLKQAYEDKFDHYVYLKDSEELIPMDSWMRDLDLSESYYFGGVIDYHW